MRTYKEVDISNLESVDLVLDSEHINVISLVNNTPNQQNNIIINSIAPKNRKAGSILHICGRNRVIRSMTILTDNRLVGPPGSHTLCPGGIDLVIDKFHFGVTLVYNGDEWRVTGVS